MIASLFKSASRLTLLLALALAGCSASQPVERTDVVTLRGKPVTLQGVAVDVGDAAPDAVLVGQDMKEQRLSDYRGKTVILSVVPSLDTGVCSTQTQRFNQEAANLKDDVVVLTMSMDLPFAQKRWCGAHNVDKVVTLSDYKHHDFGRAYGVRIKESGLLARSIYVIDPQGKVVYKQIVPELTTEPDYDAALLVASGT